MPVTQEKDLMYGGTPKTPATAPNDAIISGNGSFSISNWNGTIPVGSTVQLFIRQWTNGVGGTTLFQCWDGQTIWQWNLNNVQAWGVVGTVGGSPIWSSSSFQLYSTTQWSIIPQTGAASDPSGSTD